MHSDVKMKLSLLRFHTSVHNRLSKEHKYKINTQELLTMDSVTVNIKIITCATLQRHKIITTENSHKSNTYKCF